MTTETYLPFYERRRRTLAASNRCEKYYAVAEDASDPQLTGPKAPELPFYRRHLPVTEKVVIGVVGAASGVAAISVAVFVCAAMYLLGCIVLVGASNGGVVALSGH